MTEMTPQTLSGSKVSLEQVLEFLHKQRFQAKLLQYRDMKPHSWIILDSSQNLAAVCLVSHTVLREYVYERPTFYVEYLVVREDLQRKGLGSKLLQTVLQNIRKTVRLHCFKPELVTFYQKFGFSLVKQSPENEFLLEKRYSSSR